MVFTRIIDGKLIATHVISMNSTNECDNSELVEPDQEAGSSLSASGAQRDTLSDIRYSDELQEERHTKRRPCIAGPVNAIRSVGIQPIPVSCDDMQKPKHVYEPMSLWVRKTRQAVVHLADVHSKSGFDDPFASRSGGVP